MDTLKNDRKLFEWAEKKNIFFSENQKFILRWLTRKCWENISNSNIVNQHWILFGKKINLWSVSIEESYRLEGFLFESIIRISFVTQNNESKSYYSHWNITCSLSCHRIDHWLDTGFLAKKLFRCNIRYRVGRSITNNIKVIKRQFDDCFIDRNNLYNVNDSNHNSHSPNDYDQHHDDINDTNNHYDDR